MFQVFVIAAILVGSAYGISVPVIQSNPTTSDTGLKFIGINVKPCTALPCKFTRGTVMEVNMAFKAQADYDLKYAYNIGSAKLSGENIHMARELCPVLSIIKRDKDNNPCTVNAGGIYKIKIVRKVLQIYPDGFFDMYGLIMVGGNIIANYGADFDFVY